MRYPLIISSDFYLLWKEICGVTHELFADSINASGVLSSFCSADTADQRFGECGSWKDAEELIDGGAGHPPFKNDFLKALLIQMELNVRRNRPYCRVLILPFNENGVLRRLLDSEEVDFEGEVLTVIDRRLIRFFHQRELFKSHSVEQRPSEKFLLGRDFSDAVVSSKLSEEFNHESKSLQSAVDYDALGTDWVYE